MQTKLIAGATGIDEALFGIGLSFGITAEMSADRLKHSEKYNQLFKTARRLAHMQGGHNKFLESIYIWLDIDAPRYWWSEFDTYRVGVSKQSESTMHTITRRELTSEDFEDAAIIPVEQLSYINNYIRQWREEQSEYNKNALFVRIKSLLPESFLQRRIVCLNLKTLQNMYRQRKDHRLKQWHMFFVNLWFELDRCHDNSFIRYCIYGFDE